MTGGKRGPTGKKRLAERGGGLSGPITADEWRARAHTPDGGPILPPTPMLHGPELPPDWTPPEGLVRACADALEAIGKQRLGELEGAGLVHAFIGGAVDPDVWARQIIEGVISGDAVCARTLVEWTGPAKGKIWWSVWGPVAICADGPPLTVTEASACCGVSHPMGVKLRREGVWPTGPIPRGYIRARLATHGHKE